MASQGRHVDGRVLLPVQDIDVGSLDNKWSVKCTHCVLGFNTFSISMVQIFR